METTLLKNPLADLDKSLKPIEKVMVIISKGTLESVSQVLFWQTVREWKVWKQKFSLLSSD